MQKLIDAYKANPTNANALRVLDYLDKHPFSFLMLTSAERITLGGIVASL